MSAELDIGSALHTALESMGKTGQKLMPRETAMVRFYQLGLAQHLGVRSL